MVPGTILCKMDLIEVHLTIKVDLNEDHFIEIADTVT